MMRRLVTSIVLSVLFVFGDINGASRASEQNDVNSLTLIMYNQTYTPNQELTITDRIVKDELQGIKNLLNMKNYALHRAIHNLSLYVRIAVNGIRAAGPNYIEVDNEIHGNMLNLCNLCNQMVVGHTKFEVTALRVAKRRYLAFDYLIAGYEGMAKETILATRLDAREMTEVAVNLSNSLEKMIAEVASTFKHIKVIKANQDIKLWNLRTERTKLVNTEAKQREVVEEMKEHRYEAESQAEFYRLKLHEETQKLNSKSELTKKLVNFLASQNGWGDVFRTTSEKTVKMFSDFYKEQRQLVERRYMMENEEMEKLMQTVLRITDIDAVFGSEESINSAVAEALYHTIGALSNILSVINAAAAFWKQLEIVCDDIIKSDPVTETNVIELWKTPFTFKNYIRVSARWVAVSLISSELCGDMVIAHREVNDLLKENPTYEESRYFIRKYGNNLPLLPAASNSNSDRDKQTTSADDTEKVLLKTQEIGQTIFLN